MDFSLTPLETEWRDRVREFIDENVRPRNEVYLAQQAQGPRWKVLPVVEEMKAKARQAGLWNLFMPPLNGHSQIDDTFQFEGPDLPIFSMHFVQKKWGGLSGPPKSSIVLPLIPGIWRSCTDMVQERRRTHWLVPLMKGEARSAFLMTEPDVASSDATNIETSIVRDGDSYIISGRKWWSSGAGDPRCAISIVMGKTDPSAPRHNQQSMIVVPMDTPGVEVVRHLPVFGYDDAPHGHMEILLKSVRVPAHNMLLGDGRGFEIAQGRLGPGRIHHCMRTIGVAEEALEKMVRRLTSRVAFGKRLADQSVWEERVADARVDLEMTRLLCLKAADMMDKVGNKAAQAEIAMIKVAAPRMALKVIDDAMQAHGGAGVAADFGLARDYAMIRTLRFADGPDEVHRRAIARMGIRQTPMIDNIDNNSLSEWLSAEVQGFEKPFEIRKFPGGQSNPTYSIEAQSGSYVLRRKPFGELLPSAHAIEREYRLLTAICRSIFRYLGQ